MALGKDKNKLDKDERNKTHDARYAMIRFVLLTAGLLFSFTVPVRASDLFTVGEPQTVAGGGIGDGGPALAASLLPQSVAAGPDGAIYIADEQHNLVRAVEADGTIRTVVGSGQYGFNGERPALGVALQVPTGLAGDADGRLYLVDLGNRQVRVLGRDGVLRTLLSADHPLVRAAPGRFAPADLAVGMDGTAYVADRGNHVVWEVGADGEVRRLAGTGERGFDDDRPAREARLADPRAVAVGADGAVFIADTGNRRVRRVDPQGRISTWTGHGGELNWEGRILPWHASVKPVDLAFDQEWGLLIVDALKPRLLRQGPTAMVVEIAVFADGEDPAAVAVDGQGRYLVAGPRQVWRLDAEGGQIERVAGNGRIRASGDGGEAGNASLFQPFALAFDAEGNLHIADRRNHLVRRVRPDGTIERVAGTGAPGFGGDGGPALEARLHNPTGLAFDAEGNLHIADERNHRVRRVDAFGRIETVAGTGAPGFGGDGGPALEARLHNPTGLAFDAEGNLHIADAGNGRIRRLKRNGTIETVAGSGRTWPLEGNGPALETALLLPVDVQVDEGGRLVIVDAGAHRILRLGSDGLLRVVVGTGSAGRGADGSRAAEAALARPLGALPDGAGGVYVADSDNRRLVHVDGEGVLRLLSEAVGWPARLARPAGGGLVFADIGGNKVGRLAVARRWVSPEERVRLPAGHEVEAAAGLPVEGLLEVVYDPHAHRLYVTHKEGLDRVLDSGVRVPHAPFQARLYSTLPAAEGLYVGTPEVLGRPLPLTLIRPGEEPFPERVELWFEGADALGWSDGLLVHQRSGRVLRLEAEGLREVARLAPGEAVLQGAPDGTFYIALKPSRELLRAQDLDGDGRVRGPLELRSLAFLEAEPVAMAYQGGLHVATAGCIFRLEEGDRLEEFASGFAPGLLDIAAGPGGEIYALEGETGGGRLLRLRPAAPALGVWPQRLDFGGQILGEAGTRTVVLRNDGSLPVVLELEDHSGAQVVGDPVRLEPGEVRQVEVRLAPRQPGLADEVLVWRSAADGEELLRLPVAIEGLAPVLQTAAAVDFGVVPVGGQGNRILKVRNDGSAPLEIRRIKTEEDFTHGFAEPAILVPGGELEIGLSLSADERRGYEGTLRIFSNDPEGEVRTIPLRGRGGQAELGPVPAALDLGPVLVGQAGQQNLELKNAGEVDLLVQQVLTGTRRLIVSPRQAVIPPGATRILALQFRPGVYGQVEGELSFVTNDPERPEVGIPFSGKGLSSRLQISAAEHAFPPVSLGESRIWYLVLSNLSPQPVAVEEVASNNAQFRVVSKPGRLGPGGRGMVQVEYRPTRPGETRGVLSIRTDLDEAPQVDVALRARARVPTRLSLEPVAGPLHPGAEIEVPVRVQEAVDLNGLVLELSLPAGAEFLGVDFPGGSLFAGEEGPLFIETWKGAGRLEVGISLTGERAAEGISGAGLLGLLRFRTPGGGSLAIERAVFRAASGAVDTLVQETAVELVLMGDFDGNGRVDLADFFVLVDRLGQFPEGEQARFDLDGDGRIDAADVSLLLELLSPEAAAKAAAELEPEPAELRLLPAYPNPFNAEVTLSLAVPREQAVELVIYNALGQQVRALVAGRLGPGVQRVAWDGRDDRGRAAGSGLYLAVLRGGTERRHQRLLRLR